MGEARLIPVETFLGSITKAKCSVCSVGFAQRYFRDPCEAERQMAEYFCEHVAQRHSEHVNDAIDRLSRVRINELVL